jgi:hypothetical protein
VSLIDDWHRQNKDKHFNEDVNDIMIIPDLDEDGGGDSDARGKYTAGGHLAVIVCLLYDTCALIDCRSDIYARRMLCCGVIL